MAQNSLLVSNEDIQLHRQLFNDEIDTLLCKIKSQLFSDEDYNYYINTIDNWSTIPGKKEPIQYVIHRQYNYVEIDGEKYLYKISENEFHVEKTDDKVIKTIDMNKFCKVVKRSELFDQLMLFHCELVGHGSGRILYNAIKTVFSNITREICELFVKLCPCQVNKKLIKNKAELEPIMNEDGTILPRSSLLKKESRCSGCKQYGHTLRKCPVRDNDNILCQPSTTDNTIDSVVKRQKLSNDIDEDVLSEAESDSDNSHENQMMLSSNLSADLITVDYESRFQGMHLPRQHKRKDNGTLNRGRCSFVGCKNKNVSIECMKCNVFLCLGDEFENNCFARFHTRE